MKFNAKLDVERIVSLSITHLSLATQARLERVFMQDYPIAVMCMEGGLGLLINVHDLVQLTGHIADAFPPDLEALILWAQEECVSWLRFGTDLQVFDDFPTFKDTP